MASIKTIQQTYGLLTKGGVFERISHNNLNSRLGNASHPQFLDGNTKICNFYNAVTQYDFRCRNDKDGSEIGIIAIIFQDDKHIKFQLSKAPLTTASIFYLDDLAYKWKGVTAVGSTLTINSTNQEIIYANNVQFTDNYNIIEYNNYLTALATDFQIKGYSTGNVYLINSILNQTAGSITFEIDSTPLEAVNVKHLTQATIQWLKITTVGNQVTISRNTQMFHSNTNTVDGNGAINSALDRIYNVSDVVGMVNENDRSIDYPSSNQIVDNETLITSIGKLDAKIGANSEITVENNILATDSVETQVDKIDIAIGNRTYTNDNLLVDGESITASLDKLDIKIGKETEILANNIVTATESLESNINDIVQVIGDRAYDSNVVLTDGESVTASLNAIENFVNQEFWNETEIVPCSQAFAKVVSQTVYTISLDENADTPFAIVDGTKVFNHLDYFVITDSNNKPIYKQGLASKLLNQIVEVTAYNPITREITLNYEPSTDFTLKYLYKYTKKDIPTGKADIGLTPVQVINNEATNEADEIEYDNSTSEIVSTNVKSAIDEVYQESKYKSNGIISYPTLIKNGDGTFTIQNDGSFIIPNLNSINTRMLRFDNVVGGTFTPTNYTISFLYVQYNGGNPIYTLTSDFSAIENDFTKVLVYRIIREDATIHTMEYDGTAEFLSNKMLVKDIRVRGFERYDGLTLSTLEGRIADVSTGSIYFGIQKYNTSTVTSGAVGNMYEYYLNAGNWIKSANQSQFDSTYYSDGINRLTMNSNRWVAKYFFRDVGDDAEIYYIHGNQYNSQTLARNEILPTAPSLLLAHSIYVGKIVIQQSTTLGVAYPRDWGFAVSNTTATNHEDLTNILQVGSEITNGHVSNSPQTIYGVKTFDSTPKHANLPLVDDDITNKKYTDNYAMEMAIVFG